MARNIQEPVETKKPGIGCDQESVFTHPSFGQIRASRVSGHINLYDSDFNHQHYVTISICRSELRRHLSRDWHFGRDEIIEVSLSEAQWASFVSSMNVGSGVPCTIARHGHELVAGLPAAKNPASQFKGEVGEALADLQKKLSDLADGLDGPMSKTKVAELRKNMEWISLRITDDTGFVADQFDRHVEKTVEKAKTEINAYATALVMRTGIEALGGYPVPVLEYNPVDGDES